MHGKILHLPCKEADMNILEVTNEFNEFLRKYENVEIPDILQFNNGLVTWQGKLKVIHDFDYKDKKFFSENMEKTIQNYNEIIQMAILSILSFLFDGGGYTTKMIMLVRNSQILLEDNRYFVYRQMNSYAFHFQNYLSEQGKWLNRLLYKEIIQQYKNELGIIQEVRPKEKRNKNNIVFFIGQFLNQSHGPTKTILERCSILARKMNCNITIINTNEMRGRAGYIPFCCPFYGNNVEEYQRYNEINFEGNRFGYVQCSEQMPNKDEILNIVEIIKKINPYCLFMVGDSSVCADLCSNYYPLIDIGTVPSAIMATEGQFLLKGTPITEKDREYIRQLGKSDNYLQYCLFTSSLVPQTKTIERSDIGVLEKDFVAIVVGGRLDYEVNIEFIENVLCPIAENGVKIVFMGRFESYSEIIKKYPIMEQYSVFVGWQSDVLAVNAVCDIYLNPRRYGGGTSVIEAMVKGVPPVTLSYGDVALGAGEEFCVRDYQEMVSRVLQMKDDETYYHYLSEKALKRADIMLDGESAFWKVFKKIESLEEFQ